MSQDREPLPRGINEISGDVVDASMKVHAALGPGLLESAYETCLAHELTRRGRKARWVYR
nr:GxxExxY protein [Gammaproteobacteria bacterium]